MTNPVNEVFECLAALYEARFGRLAPGKDDCVQESNSAENRAQYSKWLGINALYDACRKIIELEQRIDEMQEVAEGAAECAGAVLAELAKPR